MRQRPVASHAAALAVFTALAIVQTWPLAASLSSAVPGEVAGDNLGFVWNFWWARDVLASPDVFLFTPFLLHPYGAPLVLHTHVALQAFLGATILGALSPVAAYNATILYCDVLNGFCAYLLAHRITRAWGPSTLAGLMFGAGTYFAAHTLGHLNLLAGWLLPLAAIAANALAARRAAWRIVACGLILGAAAYASYYYAVYIAVLYAAVLAFGWFHGEVRIRASGRFDGLQWTLLLLLVVATGAAATIALTGGFVVTIAGQRVSATSGVNLRTFAWLAAAVFAWRRWRPAISWSLNVTPARIFGDAGALLLAGFVALALAAPLVVAAAQLIASGGYVAPEIRWRSGPSGIDLVSLVAGNPYHPLWGSWSRALQEGLRIDVVERSAWLGLVPCVVIAIAWRRLTAQRSARLWLFLGGLFLLWALGPWLLVLGINTALPLPQSLLQLVPILSNARVPSRAMVVVTLAAAVLFAVALDRLRWSRATTAILGVALVVDLLAAPIPMLQVDAPAPYLVLETLPPGGVLELPAGYRDGFHERGGLNAEAVYHQTLHHHPIVGGFVARMPPAVAARYAANRLLDRLFDLSERDGSGTDASCVSSAAADLAALDVSYVMLDTRTARPALQQFARECLPVRLVTTDGRRELLSIGR
jgi:hypothetical protein